MENVQTKRMTSITRRLHFLLIRKKAALYLGADFLIFVLLSLCCPVLQEYILTGTFSVENKRVLLHENTFESIIYQVSDKSGSVLFQIPVYNLVRVMGIVILVIVIFQIISIIGSYTREDKKIRRILQPINEIALQADKLSHFAYSEDKYQLIEDTIANIKPEDAKILSFGDEDLQGIEAAMNNLLLRMRDSYRQQARFVNDASHELRTPIAVIQGYANMLSRWGKEDEKVLDESIAAISHESEHMKHLVEQLLFLARGDSGKTVLHKEDISLNELMQEIYEESLMIDEKHHYRLNETKDSVRVTADEMMLKQAVRILVDNAAKYTKDGDDIVLEAGKMPDGHVYIQVQDTGIGMAETDVEHMFERFYRSDEARGYQGTGLGLSIAKWIIDKHQGHFEILSRTELGTRIRIVL
jgi:signal transduction histidine kinase